MYNGWSTGAEASLFAVSSMANVEGTMKVVDESD